MIDSSKDILYITIAVCISAFTLFSCWGLYYFVGVLRNFFKISKDVRNVIKKTEEILDAIKGKINSSASYFLLIGEAVKKILEIMNDRGAKFPFGKKDKKKKKEEAEE